jgi:hypothetical protein
MSYEEEDTCHMRRRERGMDLRNHAWLPSPLWQHNGFRV